MGCDYVIKIDSRDADRWKVVLCFHKRVINFDGRLPCLYRHSGFRVPCAASAQGNARPFGTASHALHRSCGRFFATCAAAPYSHGHPASAGSAPPTDGRQAPRSARSHPSRSCFQWRIPVLFRLGLKSLLRRSLTMLGVQILISNNYW